MEKITKESQPKFAACADQIQANLRGWNHNWTNK